MKHFQRPFRNNEQRQILRPLPDLAPNTIRIIGIGGNEESGRNMWAIEYRDTIVVLDGGIQYGALKTPGIDFILPNPAYLKEKRHKVKAIIATSPHMDHVGAIPYFATDFPQATIYARNITGELIIKLAPQIVISPSAPDKLGQPLVMERFDFSPKEVFEAVTIDQYITYVRMYIWLFIFVLFFIYFFIFFLFVFFFHYFVVI